MTCALKVFVNDNVCDVDVLEGEVTEPLDVTVHHLLGPLVVSKSHHGGLHVTSDTLG